MIERLETIYGPMFVPSTDSGQYDWLKNTGASPEDELIELVCSLLDERPRGIAIDAGANFGAWSLPLALHAERVIAIEPQKCVREVLMKTLGANVERDIRVFSCALGSKPGIAQFPDISLEKSSNFGGVAINVPHSEHPDAPMYTVPIHTIDLLMKPYEGERISIIKADIEGSEMEMLHGAMKTIARWKPILVAEADHPNTDTQALGSFIESLGYNVEVFREHNNNFIGLPV